MTFASGTKSALFCGTMKPNRERTSGLPSILIGMGVLLVLLLGIGCSEEGGFAPESEWQQLRYHWSEEPNGTSYGDVVIEDSGEIEWVMQGQSGSTRGLLAGENLETLARLIGALPPAGYQGPTDCESSFFLTTVVDGESRRYVGSQCDPDLPAAIADVSQRIETWAKEDTVRKADPIAFRVLAHGSRSDVGSLSRRIASNRDELLQLVELLGEDRLSFLPSVDFRREIVVGIFLGQRSTAGYGVTVTGTSRTEGGRVVIDELWEIPGEGCGVAQVLTSPWVFISVAASANEDLLFEPELLPGPCGDGLTGELP